ncbi:hypothetical protein XENOCAPTIV_029231 [Xenoophorus captivus]|uniref:Uncharacterized protein n=1 Tax=Xenoophorus captivus TaxID=1517983 RepID=A0ABV0RJT8_9TELE
MSIKRLFKFAKWQNKERNIYFNLMQSQKFKLISVCLVSDICGILLQAPLCWNVDPFLLTELVRRLHGGTVGSTAALLQGGPAFNSWLGGSFCKEFTCSPRACVGSYLVLSLPPTVQKHEC